MFTARHCDLTDSTDVVASVFVSVLPPTGYVDGRIDRQVHLTSTPKDGRPEDLPALAFCLLFRFQGAEARAHLGGGVLPAWLGAGALPEACGLSWSEEKH